MTTLNAKAQTVTPAMAERWLKRQELIEKNDPTRHNRSLRKYIIDGYAEDMTEDRWDFNGETLKFAPDGRIIDGQHRLHACVRSGRAFRTLVVDNVPDPSFKTIDIGKARSMGDLLGIQGIKHGTHLGAALQIVWRWENANAKNVTEWSWNATATKPELFEVLERHPDLVEYVAKMHPLSPYISHSLGAALWYIFARRDRAAADAFFEKIASGLNMVQTEPAYVLRERLIRDRQLRPQPGPVHYAELVVRAWRADRKGEQLTKLQKGKSVYDGQPVGKKKHSAVV